MGRIQELITNWPQLIEWLVALAGAGWLSVYATNDMNARGRVGWFWGFVVLAFPIGVILWIRARDRYPLLTASDGSTGDMGDTSVQGHG